MWPCSLYTCSLITIGRLTLEIYFFKINLDDEGNDDNTYQRGQTIAILKPRLSLQIIWAYDCQSDILQLEEDILRQKMMT